MACPPIVYVQIHTTEFLSWLDMTKSELDQLEEESMNKVKAMTEINKAMTYRALYLDGMRIDSAEHIIRKERDAARKS